MNRVFTAMNRARRRLPKHFDKFRTQLSAFDTVSNGLALPIVSFLPPSFIFHHLQTQHVWQPHCTFELSLQRRKRTSMSIERGEIFLRNFLQASLRSKLRREL